MNSNTQPIDLDPNATTLIRITGVIAYYVIVYPVAWLLYFVNIFILHPALVALEYITYPFVRLLQFIYTILAVPFRILATFEPILTYLLPAALLGLLFSLVLFTASKIMYRLLSIDAASEAIRYRNRTARTVAQFRAERAARKAYVDQATSEEDQKYQSQQSRRQMQQMLEEKWEGQISRDLEEREAERHRERERSLGIKGRKQPPDSLENISMGVGSGLLSPKSPLTYHLAAHTILEEEDSDDSGRFIGVR